MKRIQRKIAFLLAAALFASAIPALAADTAFRDVKPTHWAREYIEQAFADGAVNGTYYNERTGERWFEPEKTLTVAEFAAVLTRALFPAETKAAEAAKKPSDKWYAPYMKVAYEKKLFYRHWNHGDELVTPTQDCNRYIVAVMLTNVIRDRSQHEYHLPWEVITHLVKDDIPDWDSIPEEYRISVASVCFLGITIDIDKNAFAGEQTVTRAQMAAIYCRTKDALTEYEPDDSEPVTSDLVNLAPDLIAPTPDPAVTTQKLTNGKPATAKNVLELLDELKVTKYPNKSYYDSNTPYDFNAKYPDGLYHTGTQCAKLVYMISDDIFGYAPARRVESFMDLRPGDIIQWKTHWSICISYPKQFPATGEWYVETVSGDSDGYIVWGDRAFSNNANLEAFYTRY